MRATDLAGKTVLYGHFGLGNIGNDSSLEGALVQIRKFHPHCELICVCSSPRQISERFGIRTLPLDVHAAHPRPPGAAARPRVVRFFQRLAHELAFWWRYRSWFRPGDRLIIAGTGAVDDMSTPAPWGAPYDLYKWCKAAKLGGAQLLFVNVGVGPILNRVSRMLMLRALGMADYRSYRDQAAFDYLRSVHVPTTGDLLYPDLAFALRKDAAPTGRASGEVKQVGVGLINYHGWHGHPSRGEAVYQRYRTNIEVFISWLLDRGMTVRIVSGDIGDRRIVDEIAAHFRHSRADRGKLVVEPIDTLDELIAQMAQTDIVVASRFHNVVCALSLGIPVISVGYHDKNVNLMSEMGMEDYCQHIEEFTAEKLMEQFDACLRQREQVVSRIDARLRHYRQLLDAQFQQIFEPGRVSVEMRDTGSAPAVP